MSQASSEHDFRFEVIEAGYTGNVEIVRSALAHESDSVRVSAIRALHRMSVLTAHDLTQALNDRSAKVRRAAVELSARFTEVHIVHLLNDDDVFVAEMSAWSLGERENITEEELTALITATTTHSEVLVREAAAAALGSIGDERGLPAILSACADKPTVRRRAILALAPFEGEEVENALQKALEDNDWQVRQNAEILLHPRR